MHETETYHHPDTGEAISFSLPSEEAPAMARPEDKKAAAFAFEESEPPPATRQNQDTFDELDRSIAQSMAPEKPLPKAMERSFEPLENNLKIPRKMNDTNATLEKLLSKMQSLETKVAQLTNGHTSAPTEEYVREQSVEQAHTHGEWKAENIEIAEAQSHQPPSGAEAPSEGDAFPPDEPSQAMDTTSTKETKDKDHVDGESVWEQEDKELLELIPEESVSTALSHNDALMSEIMSLKERMDATFKPASDQDFVREMALSPDKLLEIEAKLTALDQKFAANEDMTREEFKAFVKWQKEKIPELENKFRTCGIEFEFAQLKMKRDDETLPLHVELLESRESDKINGLPIILETDAGNALEIVMPPFVIDTNKAGGGSWAKAKKRSMYLTDQFEKRLKHLAETGVAGGRKLSWLVQAIETYFGIQFSKPGMGSGRPYRTYKDYKLTDFTKNISGPTVSNEVASSAQINLNVTIAELAEALLRNQKPAADAARLQHVRYTKTKTYLTNYYTERLEEHQRPAAGKQAVIAFYLSQIPMMALGICMNRARKQWSVNSNQDKHIRLSRDAFEKHANSNKSLLVNMSFTKDFTEIWIKAGLNDMMKLDGEIKAAVSILNRDALATFFKTGEGKMETNTLRDYLTGLSGFYGTPGHFTDRYGAIIDEIITNIIALAQPDTEIVYAKKLEFPNNDAGVTFTDYAAGHPFMVRPDTHVPLTKMGSVLIEVRRMNRNLFTNTHLRPFYMPYYRVAGELAGDDTANLNDGSLMLLGTRVKEVIIGEDETEKIVYKTVYEKIKKKIDNNDHFGNLITMLNNDEVYQVRSVYANSVKTPAFEEAFNYIAEESNVSEFGGSNPKTLKNITTLKSVVFQNIFGKILYPRLTSVVKYNSRAHYIENQDEDNFKLLFLPVSVMDGKDMTPSPDRQAIFTVMEMSIIEELKAKYKGYGD